MGPFQEATTGAVGLVQQVVELFDKVNSYAGRKSLIDVSKDARVEPTLIVDAALMGTDYLPAITQNMQAIFAGYYLQAIEMMHTIDGIQVKQKLAPLNPNRTPNVALMSHAGVDFGDWRMHKASYAVSLPTRKNVSALGLESFAAAKRTPHWGIAVEAAQNNPNMAGQPNKGKRNPGDPPEYDELEKERDDLKKTNKKLREKLGEFPEESARVEKDVTKMVTDVSPLSVGKLYEVTFRDGKEVAVIKVAIRLMAKMVPTSSIVSVCTIDSHRKKDIVERFHGVRSGELEFIDHFVLCNDLIDEHRRAAIKDKSGLYKEILARRNKSLLAGLLERNPSVAVASNLVIMDSTTMETIEAEMGGSFKNDKIRNQVFETTSLMILAVVDRGYDRVRFYHRGIDGYSDVSVKEMKAGQKDDGNQVADIMKAFLKGSAPQL